jgi:hypothetical protein
MAGLSVGAAKGWLGKYPLSPEKYRDFYRKLPTLAVKIFANSNH